MVVYLKEEKAKKLFKKYHNRAVFSTDRAMLATTLDDGTQVGYLYTEDLYPSTDELAAYVRGDLSAKKIIKTMKKRVLSVKQNEDTRKIQIAVSTVISILTDSKGAVVVFLKSTGTDDESKKLNKLYKKYLEAMFDLFGIKLHDEVPKKLLKGKRKVVNAKMARYAEAASSMNKAGRYLSYALKALHYAEVQNACLDAIKEPEKLSKREHRVIAKRFTKLMTGSYAKDFAKCAEAAQAKGSCKKILKQANKQIDKNLRYYAEYRSMINNMGVQGIKKLPKIKKLNKVKPKDIEKFEKFFAKSRNYGLLKGAYLHIIASIYGIEIGSSEYNKMIAAAHRMVPAEGFAKTFSTLATELLKQTKRKAQQ